jgi:hypothetical protein
LNLDEQATPKKKEVVLSEFNSNTKEKEQRVKFKYTYT